MAENVFDGDGSTAEDSRGLDSSPDRAEKPSLELQTPAGESKSRFEEIFERITDGVLSFDAAWRFTYLNAEGAKTLGRAPEELIGKNLWDEFPELVETDFGKTYLRAARENVPLSFEGFYAPFDKWFNARAYPSESGLSIFFLDITERKKSEEESRQNEARLQLITDSLPVLISYIDAEQHYRFVNKGYTHWFKLKREELVGKHVREIVGDAAYDVVVPHIQRVLFGEEVNFEQAIPYKSGFRKFIHVNYIPDIDKETGAIRGFFALVRDISESKLAEQEREKIHERFRLAERASNGFIYECSLETNSVERSHQVAEILGYEPEELGSEIEVWHQLVHPDDLNRVLERIQELTSENDTYEVEYRVRHKAGHWVYVEDRGLVKFDENSRRAQSIVGVTQDISERKRGELDQQFLFELGEKIRFGDFSPAKLLDEVTEMTSAHLDAARCLFIEISEAENLGRVRHEFCRKGVAPVAGEYKISDYSPETLEEIRSGRIIVNADAEHDPRTAAIYQTTYEPYDERAYVSVPLFTDGRWTAIFWVSDNRPRFWSRQEVAFLEAVGERVWLAAEKFRNDEALRESRERLQMAMDAAMIYSWEMDLETGRITWSSNLERVLGFPLPAEFGVTVNDLVHPEDREETRRKILDAVERREHYASEFRLVNPTDGEIIWVRGEGITVNNAHDGKPRFVGVTQNITERKRAEQEREELLRRENAARLQAEEANRLKDEFLATVSHELRTPLNAILGWSSMARNGGFEGETAKRAFEVIERNARNQNQIISDILDVSRIITGKLNLAVEPLELVPILQTATDTVRPALEAKHIQLINDFDFGDQRITGDSSRLQQVVWNLLSNAVKFTPEGGRIEVKLKYRRNSAEISVSDSGSGIDPSFLPFVFDRFRQADGSTNRQHGGLGLGLSIVRHLVEMHGGTVAAESAGAGQGASFTVRLPLETPAIAQNLEAESANDSFETNSLRAGETKPALGGMKILVVDDEPDALEIIDLMLTTSGAQVSAASSVPEALREFAENPPDLIISDVGMPGRDGYDLIRAVRTGGGNGAEIPAIALTAYARAEDREKALAAGYQAHLPKPVEMNRLIELIKNLK